MKLHASIGLALVLAGSASAMPQDGNVSLPSELLDYVNALLPERNNSGASFLDPSLSPNLEFTGNGTAEVTFIFEGAGYRNSLGYFTYREEVNGDITILSSNLIIENCSMPSPVSSGDTFLLRDEFGGVRTFTTGERVGFFLVADGFSTEPLVQNFNPSAVAMPSSNPRTNRFFGRGCYTSICELNPEWKMGAKDRACHLAMVETPGIAGFHGGDDFFLCGFEDLNRRRNSDEDFNDLVFVVRADPATSVTSGAEGSGTPALDDDNDGVPNSDDAFPADPDRAFVQRYPSSGSNTLVFEDRYPELGDADYNDAVIAYNFEQITDAAGDVKEVQGTFALIGRGAGFNHEFGIHMPGVPVTATGTLSIERFLSDANETVELVAGTSLADFVSTGRRRVVSFTSTRNALPVTNHEFATNTTGEVVDRTAALSRFVMTFDTAIPLATLGEAPYDPYLASFIDADVVDIHLPGKDGFFDRPSSLPTETGATAFLDDNGYPWAMELPSDWRWPLESQEIWVVYPQFTPFVTSGGLSSPNWYETPASGTDLVSLPTEEYTRESAFTIQRSMP